MSSTSIIPPHGGYRKLRSFQTAQLAYDATVVFCNRFIDKRSRTHDQMVQAARSGVQNIAEGSMASATSKKTELKLTGVARASLEELLLDYEDYLRQHGLRLWDKNSGEALEVRGKFKSDRSDNSDKYDRPDDSDGAKNREDGQGANADKAEKLDPYGIGTASEVVAANTIICIINQASYLLKRQMENLEQKFLNEGGFTERLYRERQNQRRLQG
jgi:restriction system protein